MDYKILKYKEWVYQEGCYPSRIVLLEINKACNIEYSTHIECLKADGKTFLVHGHYYTNIKDAKLGFYNRNI